MKTTSSFKEQFLMVFFIVAPIFAHVNDALAQQYYRLPPKLFLGLEAGTGPRSFKIDSDIKELHGLKVHEEGFYFGVMFGINNLQVRAHKGLYKASAAAGQRIDMAEFLVGTNYFPFKSSGKKGKYVKPYISANVNASKVIFFGSYALPQEPLPAAPPPAVPCKCTCPEGLPIPDDPIAEPIEQSSEAGIMATNATTTLPEEKPVVRDSNLGNIRSARADVGLGTMIHLPTRRYFMNLFAEAKYGLTFNQRASNYGFSNTKISNPFIINLGISIGLKN
jgi:hypothetical protein